jgi:hypothetical protein
MFIVQYLFLIIIVKEKEKNCQYSMTVTVKPVTLGWALDSEEAIAR